MQMNISGGSVFFFGMLALVLAAGCAGTKKTAANKDTTPYAPFDDTRATTWTSDFKLVDIKSKEDGHVQKAYFYHPEENTARPLIVSLHTWSGDYAQEDEIAKICQERELNYIHPDFRGANNSGDACCSALAMDDIDAAIDYAISHAKADKNNICVVGVSGGGYATLSFFMQSKHSIKSFSAWASISDLVAWYQESKERKRKYADDILKCTLSDDGQLNIENAKAKSPMYWQTPVGKVSSASLFIHAGIHDGHQGSVPVSHSINFYNKILRDCGATDSSDYVSASEETSLLKQIPPAGIIGEIGGRNVYLKKNFRNVTLVIFEGGHEMLFDVAMKEVLGE